MGDEKWMQIVGGEGIYEVSATGKARSRYVPGAQGRLGPWRLLKPWTDSHGYLLITLCLRGKQTHRKIHHLVAGAFLPAKKPTDTVLRHLNDDPADNRIENLAWGTYSNNGQDATRNCKWNLREGTTNGRAKLAEDDVREIRRLYVMGCISQRGLARRFMVSQRTICQIVRRELWRHI
jgi:hypothetical protein